MFELLFLTAVSCFVLGTLFLVGVHIMCRKIDEAKDAAYLAYDVIRNQGSAFNAINANVTLARQDGLQAQRAIVNHVDTELGRVWTEIAQLRETVCIRENRPLSLHLEDDLGLDDERTHDRAPASSTQKTQRPDRLSEPTGFTMVSAQPTTHGPFREGPQVLVKLLPNCET